MAPLRPSLTPRQRRSMAVRAMRAGTRRQLNPPQLHSLSRLKRRRRKVTRLDLRPLHELPPKNTRRRPSPTLCNPRAASSPLRSPLRPSIAKRYEA